MLLDKRDLIGRGFIFLNDPDNIFQQINPAFNIDLDTCNANDLVRYSTKLFYDQEIPVDYNKVIKISLEEYLKKHIGEKEEKEIVKMKKEEARIIEEAKIKEKPSFEWDKS